MVASFADAHTSASVLAEPTLLGDVTAAEGLTVYLLTGLSVVFCGHSTAGFHGRDPAVCSLASLCCPVDVAFLCRAGKTLSRRQCLPKFSQFAPVGALRRDPACHVPVFFGTKTGIVMYSGGADAEHRCHVSGPPAM